MSTRGTGTRGAGSAAAPSGFYVGSLAVRPTPQSRDSAPRIRAGALQLAPCLSPAFALLPLSRSPHHGDTALLPVPAVVGGGRTDRGKGPGCQHPPLLKGFQHHWWILYWNDTMPNPGLTEVCGKTCIDLKSGPAHTAFMRQVVFPSVILVFFLSMPPFSFFVVMPIPLFFSL